MPSVWPAAIIPTPIAAATSPNARLRTVPLRSGRRSTVSSFSLGRAVAFGRIIRAARTKSAGEPERDEVERARPASDDRGANEHAQGDADEPGDDDAPPAGPRVEPHRECDREPAAEDAEEVPHERREATLRA